MGKFKFTLLGCGGSAGVPLGANWWGECDPKEPRNRRQRPAAFVQSASTDILIDAGPDIRHQLLGLEHQKIDHLIVTHEHSDHVAGLDDLRFYVYRQKQQMPLWTLPRTATALTMRMPHVFDTLSPSYPALFDLNRIDNLPCKVVFGDCEIEFFEQPHGEITSLGIIINDTVVYSTDCVDLSEETLNFIAGKKPKVWIVDAAVKQAHYSHSDVENTIAWVEQVGAEHNVLTHLGHGIDYGWLKERTKAVVPFCEPGFDGMRWEWD